MEDENILCAQAVHNMYGVQPEILLSEASAPAEIVALDKVTQD